jgi:nucleotide-binding universal stress UspA family protein
MTTEPEPGGVVVGVDGGGASRTTIKMAAQEATYRGVPLIAVMAYSGERAVGAPAVRPVATLRTGGDERRAAELVLRAAVVDALGAAAGRVELRTALGLAGRNLVDVARGVNAQLIVLAGRGSTSMLLGTVSQYVLRKAPCPVLVVPEARWLPTAPALAGASPDKCSGKGSRPYRQTERKVCPARID